MKKIIILAFGISVLLFSCKGPEGYVDIYRLDYRIEHSSAPYDVYFYLNVDYYGDANDLEVTWDFGDGNTSNEAAPIHTYYDDKVYNVTVTLKNYETTVTKQLSIDLTTPHTPIAKFDWYPLGNNTNMFAPAEVQFINLSRFADSYLWDFGDELGSTETEPSHIFENPNYYYVTLKVYSGQDTVETTQEIDVNEVSAVK